MAVLEKNIDELNVTTWQPQIEGSKTGCELPAIVDEIVTMTWIDFGDRKPVRARSCARIQIRGDIRRKIAAESSNSSNRRTLAR